MGKRRSIERRRLIRVYREEWMLCKVYMGLMQKLYQELIKPDKLLLFLVTKARATL
jgi:hypothetical protein